jgi:hypothetical protein
VPRQASAETVLARATRWNQSGRTRIGVAGRTLILEYRNDGKMAYDSLRDRFAAALVGQALRQGRA